MIDLLENVIRWTLIVFIVSTFCGLAIGAFIREGQRKPTPKPPLDQGATNADPAA